MPGDIAHARKRYGWPKPEDARVQRNMHLVFSVDAWRRKEPVQGAPLFARMQCRGRMPWTTIRLERSAYELLKGQKRPGESFSKEIARLLGEGRPSLRGFLEIVVGKDGTAIADGIEAVRGSDREIELRKYRSSGRTVRRARL